MKKHYKKTSTSLNKTNQKSGITTWSGRHYTEEETDKMFKEVVSEALAKINREEKQQQSQKSE